MPKATVLFDEYRWHDEVGDPSTPVNSAAKDETIDVSADELKRGVELGALKATSSRTSGGDPWKDVTVEKMDAYAAANDVADYPSGEGVKKPDRVKAFEDAGVSPDLVAAFDPTP